MDNRSFPDLLEPFRRQNPECQLEISDDAASIREPWGDDSLVIRVPREAGDLISALNSVRLPPRFSALWHDTGDLEFIFSPLRSDNDVARREFEFRFGGSEYHCEYAPCSKQLTLIANAARPAGPQSVTAYRNLPQLRSFNRVRSARPEAPLATDMAVISFWIREVAVDEAQLDSLFRHLNFFATYFDRRSPQILIHEEPVRTPSERPVRYPSGDFPRVISGRPLDPYLLVLWEGAKEAPDPIRRFLYNYQILEYASFYYLREDVLAAVRRVVIAPDAPSRVEEVSRTVLEAIADDRMSDEAKIVQVVQQAVDPAFLWLDISANEAYYSQACLFDGGFELQPLIKAGWRLEDFRASWIPKVPDTLRKIRNALVHAREQRQARCIAPNVPNQHLLRPWVVMIESMAWQVILYRPGV